VKVVVGLPGKQQKRAKRWHGPESPTSRGSHQAADVIMVLVPITFQGDLYTQEIRGHTMTKGKTLMFAHGFNIHFGQIKAACPRSTFTMIAPKAPVIGTRAVTEGVVCQRWLRFTRTPADTSSRTLWHTFWALGLSQSRSNRDTFKENNESDLFGEQSRLCGGVSELIRAGFETLVEAAMP